MPHRRQRPPYRVPPRRRCLDGPTASAVPPHRLGPQQRTRRNSLQARLPEPHCSACRPSCTRPVATGTSLAHRLADQPGHRRLAVAARRRLPDTARRPRGASGSPVAPCPQPGVAGRDGASATHLLASPASGLEERRPTHGDALPAVTHQLLPATHPPEGRRRPSRLPLPAVGRSMQRYRCPGSGAHVYGAPLLRGHTRRHALQPPGRRRGAFPPSHPAGCQTTCPARRPTASSLS